MSITEKTMIDKNSQKIFNNSLLYSIGTVASKAVGFLLVPIYTYNMSEGEYGIATTMASFVSTFGIVVMLSLRAAMIRFYNGYDDEEKKSFVGTIVTFVILNATVVCTLLCLFHELYAPFLFRDISFFPCVFLGIMSLGTETVYLLYQSLLQARQDGRAYSINSMVYLFFHALTVVVLVGILKRGAEGAILANLITNSVFAVYGIISMYGRKYMVPAFDTKMLSRSLKYSIPILPHNLSSNLSTYSIKIIINNFLGYAVSGIYTLGTQFASILNMVQSSVNLAFRPWFIEQMDNGEEGRAQIKHMSCMIMSLLSMGAVAISLFSREIVTLLADSAYTDAWKMVPFFLAAQLISFIYYTHVQTLMYDVRMSKYTVVCSFSGLAVNVSLAYVLVCYFDMQISGILLAQIVSQIVMAVITVIMSNYSEHIDFGLKYMIFDVLTAAILSFAGTIISVYVKSVIISVILKLFILCIAFLIYIFKYAGDYTELIKGIISKKHRT